MAVRHAETTTEGSQDRDSANAWTSTGKVDMRPADSKHASSTKVGVFILATVATIHKRGSSQTFAIEPGQETAVNVILTVLFSFDSVCTRPSNVESMAEQSRKVSAISAMVEVRGGSRFTSTIFISRRGSNIRYF